MSLISFSTLCGGLCKRRKKLGLRSFLFKFERKPVVQKLAMEVGNRKGERLDLVWFGASQLFVPLFICSLLQIL